MALTYTDATAAADEIREMSSAAKKRVSAARLEIANIAATLAGMQTTYSPVATEVNTTAAANPSNAAWQGVKADMAQLVADFLVLKTTADNLVTAVNAVQ